MATNTHPQVPPKLDMGIGSDNYFLQTDIIIRSQRVQLKFGAIVADTPARSLIKGSNLLIYAD